MTRGDLVRTMTLSGCLVAAGIALQAGMRPEAVALREPLASFPTVLGNWRGAHAGDFDASVLAILGVSEYLNRIYVDTNRSRVGLYIGYYENQRQGQSIHSPLNCLPGSGWQPMTSGRATIDVPPGSGLLEQTASPATSIEVNRYVVQKGLDRMLVLYWYQSHGRVIASEYWGKFYMVADAIRLNRTDAALIRVMVPLGGAAPDAEAAATRSGIGFVQAIFPRLARHLPV